MRDRYVYGGSGREQYYSIEETHRRIDRKIAKGMEKVLVELGLREPEHPRPDDVEIDIRAVLESLGSPKEEEEMTEPKGPKYPDIHVTLTRQDGNAFAIMARVTTALRRNRVPQEEIKEYQTESKSGDYDHLRQTAERWVSVS